MKLLIVAVTIACSLLVLAIGMPTVESSQQETRCAQAFIQAQQIKAGELPEDSVDPWGTPFRISKEADGRLIVTSFGANRSTPTDGFDDDDVSSAMTSPPHKKMIYGKQRQLLTILILAASPWVVFAILLMRSLILRLRPTGPLMHQKSQSP